MICGVKGKNDFEKCKKNGILVNILNQYQAIYLNNLVTRLKRNPNPLTLPTGRQAQRAQRIKNKGHKEHIYKNIAL